MSRGGGMVVVMQFGPICSRLRFNIRETLWNRWTLWHLAAPPVLFVAEEPGILK